MAQRIYVTHCSAKKNNEYKGTLFQEAIAVTPDKLYTGQRTQAFMKRCMALGVDWAIFSDKYGIVMGHEKIKWYEKHPDKVTPGGKKKLLKSFVYRLRHYEKIFFYHNPPRFHRLYREILEVAKNHMRSEIILISSVKQITRPTMVNLF
jgi:hypothetical protein